MRIRRIAVSGVFAAGLVALPLATAEAQYYYPPYPLYPPACSPFPLFWPFCVVGALIGLVAAPFVALTAPPYYYGYYGYGYYGRPYYPPPRYYAPGYPAAPSSAPGYPTPPSSPPGYPTPPSSAPH